MIKNLFMLKKHFLCLIAIFVLACSEGQVHSRETFFQHIVDSLERIQPTNLERVKPRGHAFIIDVKSQKDFDNINANIDKAISVGERNIQVKIRKGVYQFFENHINRSNEKLPNISISIIGYDAVLTSDNNYPVSYGLGDGWQDMLYADSIIKVVNANQNICLLPFSNQMTDEEKSNITMIQVTQWFRAPIYTVTKINREGIYFIEPELNWETEYGHKGYNVNFDYLYLGKIPRFKLYNTSKEHHCTASRFLNIEYSRYRCFSITGVVFKGNRNGNPLISLTDVEAKQISISYCRFNSIRDNVINASGTGNVVFDHNSVTNTIGNEIRFVKDCPNVRITDNLFENCGQSIGNTFCVTCWESKYYIARNTFRDFGYGAIGVGVWYGFEKKNYSGGIIEHNEIYFTPDYFTNAWKHMLMDSGAIYTWTQNDDVIVRYNYIHDYTGPGDNRGIFCDDGANNLKIYGNVVMNTPNCYSIDSRMSEDQKEGFRNNENNFMAQNIVDNRVRFQGHANIQRHVLKGGNYVIRKSGDTPLENKYENLEHIEEDIVLYYSDKKIRKHIKKCVR